MKRCPNCQKEMADGIAFCQACGTRMPETAQQVPMAPAKKSGGNKGLVAALCTSVVINVLLIALLVSWTLGLFGPSARERALQEQVEELEELVQDRLPGGEEPAVPTDPADGPTDPGDDPTDPSEQTVPTTVPAETEPPRESFTIRVWAPMEDMVEDDSWLEEIQTRFAAEHPEYDITWVNEAMAEGDATWNISSDPVGAADVYMFANDQLFALIEAGGISKLGGSFREQVLNDNSQVAIESVTYSDGGIYGFPVANNNWFLYYDKDVFTQEDVQSLDTMLSKGRVCVPFTVSWNAGCFFLGTGCTVFGPSGNDASAGIQFGDEKGYDAARKMVEVASHPNCVSGGMDVGMLMNGEVDAVFCGSWSKWELELALGDRLGIAMLPSFEVDGQSYHMTALSGTKCVGVNPNTGSVKNKQKVCTYFAAFMASQEAQLLRYEMRGEIPAAVGLRDHELIRDDPLAVAQMDTALYCSAVQPGLSEIGSYWDPIGRFGMGIANGDIDMDNYMDMVDLMMQEMNGVSSSPPEDSQMITVHARVPEGWTDIHCWPWSEDGTVYDSFPGGAMEQVGSWYEIQIPAWVTALLIYGDDGNGGAHSGDLSLEPGRDVWVDVYGSLYGEVFYEDPLWDA